MLGGAASEWFAEFADGSSEYSLLWRRLRSRQLWPRLGVWDGAARRHEDVGSRRCGVGAPDVFGGVERCATAHYNSRAILVLSYLPLLAAPPLDRLVEVGRHEVSGCCVSWATAFHARPVSTSLRVAPRRCEGWRVR